MALFGWSRRVERQDALENVIGPTTSLRGHIKSDGGARIDGRFEGRIEVAGNVIVTEHGCVVGDIFARDVTIGGTVEGNVEGAGRLEILATGKLFGDVTAAAILIDDGGVFEGISRMRGAARPALPPPSEALPALEDVVIDLDRRPDAPAAPTPESAPESESEAPSAQATTTPPPSPAVDDRIIDLAARSDDGRDAQRGPAAVAAAAARAAAALNGTETPPGSEEAQREKAVPAAAEPVDRGNGGNRDDGGDGSDGDATKSATKPDGSKSPTVPPRISKAAQRMIAENDLQADAIRGTGHRGMITKADVRRALAESRRAAAEPPEGAEPSSDAAASDAQSDDVVSDAGPTKKRRDTTQADTTPSETTASTASEARKPADAPRAATLDLSDLRIEPVIPDGTPSAKAGSATKPSASPSAPTSKRAGSRRSKRKRNRGR